MGRSNWRCRSLSFSQYKGRYLRMFRSSLRFLLQQHQQETRSRMSYRRTTPAPPSSSQKQPAAQHSSRQAASVSLQLARGKILQGFRSFLSRSCSSAAMPTYTFAPMLSAYRSRALSLQVVPHRQRPPHQPYPRRSRPLTGRSSMS